jgi:tripartite-type tricarboxylate transporter receptor subunit TctC
MSQRIFSSLAFCIVAALLSTGAVLAQPKPTRLIVAFPPGGPVDIVARAVAEQLSKELGRPVLIENKPGGNGAIAASEVMRSEPDGNTLWFSSVGAVAINPSLYEKLQYDMTRDFAPVSMVANNVELFVVNIADPAKDAAEFVANAKAKKEPATFGSTGTGSIPHMAIEQFADASGTKVLHIPYKGAAPAITDLMGGQVAGFFGDIPGLIGHVRGGKLKALGLAASRRHPALPEVKTLDEQGIKNVDTNNWYALFAPIKTPAPTLEALNKAVRQTMDNPQLKDKLLKSGAEPAPSSAKELAFILKQDTEKWAKLIRAKNIRPD